MYVGFRSRIFFNQRKDHILFYVKRSQKTKLGNNWECKTANKKGEMKMNIQEVAIERYKNKAHGNKKRDVTAQKGSRQEKQT